MKQGISRKMQLSARLMVLGCLLFVIYGILAAFLREAVAVYEYRTFSGGDLLALTEASQHFAFSLVLRVSLMGVALAICAGALFWFGLTKGMGSAVILALIGGLVGLVPLAGAHLNQGAWIMFIADNICLLGIGLGLLVGGGEILELFRGKAGK